MSSSGYNRQTGLAVVCPITNVGKSYPFEVAIPADEIHVTGVVLADQMKCLEWRGRNAEFICTPAHILLANVVAMAITLIADDDEEAE